jgi:hypothetical protein
MKKDVKNKGAKRRPKTITQKDGSPEQVEPASALEKMNRFAARKEIFVAAIKKSKD